MAKNDFQYGGWNSYTLQCGMWLWEHDSEFTKWQHPAMWYVALGWHAIEFTQTSAILEFYIWFRFRPYHRSRHVILHQSAKFYPNRTTLGRKKWRHVDFQDGGSQPSWILQSNNGFFEKPMYDFLYVVNRHHSSKLLSSWENRVFSFWRQTNRRTDGQHWCTKPLSLSRAAA